MESTNTQRKISRKFVAYMLFGQIWGNLGKISCAHLKIAYANMYVQDSSGHLDIQINPRNRFEASNESMNYFAYKIVFVLIYICVYSIWRVLSIYCPVSPKHISSSLTSLANKLLSMWLSFLSILIYKRKAKQITCFFVSEHELDKTNDCAIREICVFYVFFVDKAVLMKTIVWKKTYFGNHVFQPVYSQALSLFTHFNENVVSAFVTSQTKINTGTYVLKRQCI